MTCVEGIFIEFLEWNWQSLIVIHTILHQHTSRQCTISPKLDLPDRMHGESESLRMYSPFLCKYQFNKASSAFILQIMCVAEKDFQRMKSPVCNIQKNSNSISAAVFTHLYHHEPPPKYSFVPDLFPFVTSALSGIVTSILWIISLLPPNPHAFRQNDGEKLRFCLWAESMSLAAPFEIKVCVQTPVPRPHGPDREAGDRYRADRETGGPWPARSRAAGRARRRQRQQAKLCTPASTGMIHGPWRKKYERPRVKKDRNTQGWVQRKIHPVLLG